MKSLCQKYLFGNFKIYITISVCIKYSDNNILVLKIYDGKKRKR